MKFGIYSLLAGLATLFLSLALDIHRSVDLPLLFHARGSVPPPSQVIIIGIDKYSADRLNLPNSPSEWPRSTHAKLLDKLNTYSPSVIGFDLFFRTQKNISEDSEFARSIEKAGNVVLFGFSQREVLAPGNSQVSSASIERLVTPPAIFTNAALAIAPFPLPKVPARVDQFWISRDNSERVFTFPSALVMHHIHQQHAALAVYSDVHAANQDPNLVRLTEMKSKLLAPDAQRAIDTLLSLHQGENERYFNFYGPPQTITTVHYSDVLDGTLSDAHLQSLLHNKIVLIGLSDNSQPEQRDNFYTVFSRDDGLDLSGVELAATASANLLEHSTLQLAPLYVSFIICVVVALLLHIFYRVLSLRWLFLCGVLVMSGIWLASLWAFVDLNWWTPVTGQLVQIPLSLIVGITSRYRRAVKQKESSEQHLALHLPRDFLDKFRDKNLPPDMWRDTTYAVCLVTDAEAYTTLSERLDSRELHTTLNQYYEALFTPIRRHGGIVMDIAGDSLLAVWPCKRNDEITKHKALNAAIEIQLALRNATLLPTRIGLHAGDLSVGNVGAKEYFQFRAVGDAVNTAARIQSANKVLGTKILASAEVAQTVRSIHTRPLGEFRLSGKHNTIVLIEVFAEGEMNAEQLAEFKNALHQFQRGDIDAAQRQFSRLLEISKNDGPTLFFNNYLSNPQTNGVERDGVAVLERK